MKIKNLFPIPLLFHQVDKSIADEIEDIVLPKLHHLETYNNVKTDFFKGCIISLDSIPSLMKEINRGVDYFCEHLSIPPPTLYNYWIQDYSKNQTHPVHNHGRHEISVVYWIRSNNLSGDFKLYNPSPYNKVFYQNDYKSKYTTEEIIIPPVKGGLLMFPSYLDHEVLPGKEGCIRTTLALNYQ